MVNLAGNSSKVFNLGDWDGNWMYSDINKDRNMGRREGFMEKVIRCILIEVHVGENSKQRGKDIMFSSPEVFLFFMEGGRK